MPKKPHVTIELNRFQTADLREILELVENSNVFETWAQRTAETVINKIIDEGSKND